MSLNLQEVESSGFQPSWKVAAGVVAFIVIIIFVTVLVTWSLAKNAYAQDEPQQQTLGDLIETLDRNRIGIVVGTTKEETCVTLLNDSLGPQELPPVCTSNADILNYTDYDYGPSVFPVLGDVFEIRYFIDKGVQEGLVFFPIGSAPKPKEIPTSQPGADAATATATPEK